MSFEFSVVDVGKTSRIMLGFRTGKNSTNTFYPNLSASISSFTKGDRSTKLFFFFGSFDLLNTFVRFLKNSIPPLAFARKPRRCDDVIFSFFLILFSYFFYFFIFVPFFILSRPPITLTLR